MKYCITVGINNYPIEESDIPKVVRAMADNSVVVVKSGVFSGRAINAVVRDINAEKGYSRNYQLSGSDSISVKDMEIGDTVKKIFEQINTKLIG